LISTANAVPQQNTVFFYTFPAGGAIFPAFQRSYSRIFSRFKMKEDRQVSLRGVGAFSPSLISRPSFFDNGDKSTLPKFFAVLGKCPSVDRLT
jgi:hypothetical protein